MFDECFCAKSGCWKSAAENLACQNRLAFQGFHSEECFCPIGTTGFLFFSQIGFFYSL